MDLASNLAKREDSPGNSAFGKLSPLQKRLLVWMAAGKPVYKFANANARAIVPHHEGGEKKLLKKARTRARAWSRTDVFRQALWEWSVADLDLATPDIFRGIAAKAAAGRVDAARLVFEVTGRHAPNADVQPAQVIVQMGAMPRPVRAIEDPNVVDGDVVDVEPEEEAL